MGKVKKPEHVNASSLELREMVKAAHKGTSVIRITRKLSEENAITNSYWSAWEAGTVPLTDGLRRAVAEAFNWNNDWPENPPVAPLGALEQLQADVKRLIELTEAMSQLLREDLGR